MLFGNQSASAREVWIVHISMSFHKFTTYKYKIPVIVATVYQPDVISGDARVFDAVKNIADVAVAST